MKDHIKIGTMAALTASILLSSPLAVAESHTSVETSVNSSVYTRSNKGVTTGDDVEINGPITRGENRVDTDTDSDIGDNRVVVGNGAVDVGNGRVHVGNGVRINNDEDDNQRDNANIETENKTIIHKKKLKKRRHAVRSGMISSQSSGNGITKETYQDGDCLVERKQVGTISKDSVHCP